MSPLTIVAARACAFFHITAILLLSGCSASDPQRASAATDAQAPRLILISLDGFRADYLDRGLTPNLEALAERGVRADALRPAFPSLTFPNHYTIVTGLYPDHHGIVHNRMRDPVTGARFVYNESDSTMSPRWWGGVPIWVSAEQHGLRTATMFWPGSDVPIHGVQPALWQRYDKQVTPDQRVDTLLGWLDVPPDRRPRLLTLYFEQVDRAGHDFGPDSAELNATLTRIDASIGRLLQGMRDRNLFDTTNFVVVSDHGSTPAGADRVILIDDVVDPQRAGAVALGVVAEFEPDPKQRRYVDHALLRAHDHMECWRKARMPERFHYGHNARIPRLVCLATPGWIISSREYASSTAAKFSRGEHGYDNDSPDMRAIFIAAGPSLVQGLRVAEFDNIDIYILLANLLGIAPLPNDGNPATTRPMLLSPQPAVQH